MTENPSLGGATNISLTLCNFVYVRFALNRLKLRYAALPHAVRDSASPRHLELFSNKVKTEKDNVTKLR